MHDVLGTPSAHVGPFQEQVGQPVQAHAGGEGADETVEAAQEDADGPAETQQHQQPHEAPETRAATGHPRLQQWESFPEKVCARLRCVLPLALTR